MGNESKKQNQIVPEYSTDEECEIFKTAIAQMNIHIFVYDIPLRLLYFFNSGTLPFQYLKENECTVEGILHSGVIDADYVDIFRNLFEKVGSEKNKDKNVETLIKTHDGSREVWQRIMITNYFDSAKRPIRAIGTIQDVSGRIKTEQLYTNERQYRLAMMADSRRVYEINVTKDRFIKLESIQDSTDYGSWNLYTKAMDELRTKCVYKEDWEDFLKIALRENLIKGFQNGVTEFYCEYRLIDEADNITWSSSATHLLRDPESDDIKGFIYVKDIDKQKKQEIELCKQAEHDPLTGIYNRRTAERLICRLFEESEKSKLHAFLTLDFDEFKLVNDRFGHIKGDFLLKQMAQCVNQVLRVDDIFARIGGDEFIILLHDMESRQQIQEIAVILSACIRSIRIEEENDFSPSVSIGIAVYPNDGETFFELYKNSDRSLYDVKQHGKNNISFFDCKNI